MVTYLNNEHSGNYEIINFASHTETNKYGPFAEVFGAVEKSKKVFRSVSGSEFTVAQSRLANVQRGILGNKKELKRLNTLVATQQATAETEYDKFLLAELSGYNLFKPYDLTRMAHVREGFSSFIRQKDKKVVVTN